EKREDFLYDQAKAGDFKQLHALNQYLQLCGENGRYAQEIREKRDDCLYEQAREGNFKQLPALDQYLRVCGEGGRRTREIREKRDDLLFEEASGSPAKLREYLGDQGNTRHRDDAKKRINELYTQAIQRMRDQAKGKKIDDKW